MNKFRFASLGSGSKGNGLVVQSGGTTILLDCGFGVKEVGFRLQRLGLDVKDLDAILVTHEHSDHIGGVEKLAKICSVPVWMTNGTFKGAEDSFNDVKVRFIEGYRDVAVGEINIQPYPVPHDAQEPSQYVFDNGDSRLGVLTDTGQSTRHIEKVLSGCDALVLETNYDLNMLMGSKYPPWLKKRISGRLGHLENSDAARLLARLDNSRLKHFVAAHLSQQNNRPELARKAIADSLNCDPGWVLIADQDTGFDWLEI